MPVSKHRRGRKKSQRPPRRDVRPESVAPPPVQVADARVVAMETDAGVVYYRAGPRSREKLRELNADIEKGIDQLRSALLGYFRRHKVRADVVFGIGDELGVTWGYACRGDDAMGAYTTLDMLAMGLGVGRVHNAEIEQRLDELGELLFDALDPVTAEADTLFQWHGA